MDGREMQRSFRNYGLSQNQIAGCMGVTPAAISMIFTEKVRPGRDTEWRLLRLLSLCQEVEKIVRRRLGGKK